MNSSNKNTSSETTGSKDDTPFFITMTKDLKDIIDNYKKDDEIITELGNELENVLEFDRNGRYEFFHCGTCGGPILGHKAEKCRQ